MVYFASGDRFCFLFSITMRVHTHTHSHFSTTLFELSGLLRICGTCGGTGGKCQQADGFENSCCCAHRTGALNGFGLVRCACRCLHASPRHSLRAESLNIHFRLWRWRWIDCTLVPIPYTVDGGRSKSLFDDHKCRTGLVSWEIGVFMAVFLMCKKCNLKQWNSYRPVIWVCKHAREIGIVYFTIMIFIKYISILIWNVQE